MNINSAYAYRYSYAQQTQPKRSQSFSNLIDKDEDATLSAEELLAFTEDYSQKTGTELDITSIMEDYDSDGDGALNESEQEKMNSENAFEQLLFAGNPFMREKVMQVPSNPLAESIDSDGDKIWTSDELTQFVDLYNEATGETLDVESILDEYDADGDGSLNEDEQMNMMEAIAPPPPPPGPAPGGFPPVAGEEDSTASGLTIGETEASASESAEAESAESEADKYAALRETLKDIYARIEESLAKKEDELRVAEEAGDESQMNKVMFERLASRAAGFYEQSFWFEESSADLFLSNI